MPDPHCQTCGGTGQDEYFSAPGVTKTRYCRCMSEFEIEAAMLRDALNWVLPMAKGYAHAHPVGANAEKVAHAQAILEVSEAVAPEPAWIIKFDDADMPDELFAAAGATEAALKRFEQVKTAWNCHLFRRVAAG